MLLPGAGEIHNDNRPSRKGVTALLSHLDIKRTSGHTETHLDDFLKPEGNDLPTLISDSSLATETLQSTESSKDALRRPGALESGVSSPEMSNSDLHSSLTGVMRVGGSNWQNLNINKAQNLLAGR